MYDKVGNKVKQATAHCPKCLSTNKIIYKVTTCEIDATRDWADNELYDWVECLDCEWTGHYAEMAFMKMRSSRSVPMRNNNPNYYMNKKTKYGGKDG